MSASSSSALPSTYATCTSITASSARHILNRVKDLLVNKRLEVINLRGSNFDISNLLNRIGKYMCSLPNLEGIFLYRNNYYQDGLVRSTVEKLALILLYSKVKRFFLIDSVRKPGCLALVGRALSANTTVTELDVSSSPVNIEDLRMLAIGCAKNTTLKKLTLCNLYRILYVEGRRQFAPIDLDMIKCLGYVIYHNTSITELDLSYNDINDDMLEALLPSLFHNTSLRRVHMGDHCLPEISRSRINELLEKKPCLVISLNPTLPKRRRLFHTVKPMNLIQKFICMNEIVIHINGLSLRN